MQQELEDRLLLFLEESMHTHIKVAERIVVKSKAIDIYALMVLKRSLSLVSGFATMLRNNNFLCAAPLIRLQIDNLLRFHAAFLVVNQSEFVEDVLQGKEVRQISDQTGKKMTDAHLQDDLSEDYPWLKEAYKKASGYIHLSEEHFFNTIWASKRVREGVIEAYIGPDDKLVSAETYREALEDMIHVTHSLLTYLTDWVTGESQH